MKGRGGVVDDHGIRLKLSKKRQEWRYIKLLKMEVGARRSGREVRGLPPALH